jgi:hypothetical protein
VVEEAVNEVAKEVANVEVEIPRLQLLVATAPLAVHICNFLQVHHLVEAVRENRARRTNALLDKNLNKKRLGISPESFF